MPFKSESQRRYMYASHPAMAKRWEEETPTGKRLPRKLSKTIVKKGKKNGKL